MLTSSYSILPKSQEKSICCILTLIFLNSIQNDSVTTCTYSPVSLIALNLRLTRSRVLMEHICMSHFALYCLPYSFFFFFFHPSAPSPPDSAPSLSRLPIHFVFVRASRSLFPVPFLLLVYFKTHHFESKNKKTFHFLSTSNHYFPFFFSSKSINFTQLRSIFSLSKMPIFQNPPLPFALESEARRPRKKGENSSFSHYFPLFSLGFFAFFVSSVVLSDRFSKWKWAVFWI